MLRKRGERSGEDFDIVDLLKTLCLVKTDTTDGKKSAEVKLDEVKMNAGDTNDGEKNNAGRPSSGNDTKMETEMQGETSLSQQRA